MRKALRKSIIAVMLISTLLLSSMATFAASYSNKFPFTNITLPDNHANTTAATRIKLTDRSYGKTQITAIMGGSDGVRCWFRSKHGNGNYDSLESKLVEFTSPGTKKMYYKNSETGYVIPHLTGDTAQLRMENMTLTQFFQDHVSGYCWFN